MNDAPVAAAAAFPIVGIGASAGGLEAFEQFFRACPADTGMAFVLVPHLDPGHESLLTEILQRATAMPVVQVLDQTRVEADHVYVIPPNREMGILNRVLQLSMPELARGQRMPIDAFLRSLAEDQAERAIGIILSGTASDGTLGLRAILGAGGICMVQEPSTAKYDGMPQSAIAAGYVTHILPVEKMPAMLQEVASRSAFRHKVPAIATEKALSGMNQILLQVRSATGHDFSLYKKNTIGRRIERRMAKHNIESAAVYARYLKENRAEVQALFKELLINVTSFFRDPDAFVALKQTILPPLLAGKPEGYVFRVWVAGCATGEEAYSIGMVLLELMEEIRARHEQEFAILIYATDLDDEAIAVARVGRYPPNIAQDVSPERLRRFFIKDDAGYKVKKDVRDIVVFAVQNAVKDPPFTKLDLLSCRNLMIYMEPELQDRLIPNFHYALKPDGVLFLSASESITSHPELFSALDRRWKFYRAKHTGAAAYPGILDPQVHAPGKDDRPAAAKVVGRPKAGSASSVGDLSHRALLQNYAPASVTTDAKGNILFVHGDTGRYLRPAPGPVSNNVIEMAREGLQLELRGAILNAATQATPTLDQEVSVKTNGDYSKVRFSVRLLPGQHATTANEAGEHLLLVSFQDIVGPGKHAHKPTAKQGRGKGLVKGSAPSAEALRIEELERELAYAKENLQATIEEQQATNEELKSTNEELQSTNEELQSSNEELETSKEELQSLNEETITVNSELNSKVEQLSGMQNDMKNLLDSINTGTLFLDHQLVIRRYTPEAVKVYRLIATDVGRPLGDITSNIEGEDLLSALQGVLDTLIPREREVRTSDGAWYLARMQPYRTLDNVIAGVVLTFTNVTEFKLASIKLDAAEKARTLLAEGIVNTVSEPLIVLDGALQVISAGRSFYQHFKVTPEDTVGRKIYDLGNGQWNIPGLRQLLEDLLPQKQVLDGYVVEHDFPELGLRRMVLNARRIVTALGNTEMILLAMVAIEPLETQ
ncbi:MAG: PAS domain-containing protein [Proteobacteria bacterium]|nr:PAS domain-containing protein [Pseudomonadota bacterium]